MCLEHHQTLIVLGVCFGQSICRKSQWNSLSVSEKRVKIMHLFIRTENTREFFFLRTSKAPVHSRRELKFGREREDEGWAVSCKAVLVLQLNIAKRAFIMTSSSMNLGRKQNNFPLFDHYLFCSLNKTESLGRNINEHSIKDRYQDALKLSS